MMDHIKLVIIDGNGWWCFCSLSQDVSLFQADGKGIFQVEPLPNSSLIAQANRRKADSPDFDHSK